jgi:putative heme-binding domain-containing protein
MFGALYVVEDLDAYRADPEGYLARHPLPVADALLKSNRPRQAWTFDELSSALEQLNPGQGRSFADGKQMFQVANCQACHRLNGVGNAFGPDLSQLDPARSPAEILRDILEPSARIDAKYATSVFDTESGKVLSGLVLEETPEAVKVIENPLAQVPAVVLKRSEIVARAQSPTSLMPRGLLDPLTREEVLDLLAYIVARGDLRHPLYQAPSAHEHQHRGGH